MVFYFTATGNCLYVAKQLDKEQISIAQEAPGKRYEAEVIGVVSPVFGHDLPVNVREFLSRAEFVTNYFYMVLTFGYCQGGAAERAAAFLKSSGKRADYVNVLKMVDNALPAFDIEEELRLAPEKKTEEHLSAIRDDIAARRSFIAPSTQWDIEYHEKFLNASFKLDPETDFRQKGLELYTVNDDACVGCGICTRVCPKGCFSLTDRKARHDIADCIACLACIHACPQKAIQFTFPEKNPNARYRNPHVTLAEIIAANRQSGSDSEKAANVTFTTGGRPVTEKTLHERLARVAFVKDYRLEQLDHDSYRILVLPAPESDRRGIRGAVLDALVDVYGQGRFDIDIIEEDDALLPECRGSGGRTRRKFRL